MSYANQKIITINRELPAKNSKEPFLCVYTDRIQAASRNLNNTAFKLYMCLLMNANDFRLEFSPQYISNAYGISTTSARRAMEELIKEGYVIEESPNRFTFYELPQHKTAMKLKVEKRGFPIDDNSNELEWHTLTEVIALYVGAGYTKEDAIAAWDRDGVKEEM